MGGVGFSRRERLRTWGERLPVTRLAHWAARLDRRFAGGGRQRAARAIEVALLTGMVVALVVSLRVLRVSKVGSDCLAHEDETKCKAIARERARRPHGYACRRNDAALRDAGPAANVRGFVTGTTRVQSISTATLRWSKSTDRISRPLFGLLCERMPSTPASGPSVMRTR